MTHEFLQVQGAFSFSGTYWKGNGPDTSTFTIIITYILPDLQYVMLMSYVVLWAIVSQIQACMEWHKKKKRINHHPVPYKHTTHKNASAGEWKKRYLAHINVRVHWCRSAPTHLVLKGWDHSSIGDIKCFQEGTKLNIFFFSSCVQILWLYVKVRRDRVRRWVHVCDREKREKKGRGKREDRLGR